MELNIRGEKTNITEAMKQYAEEKIQKLYKYLEDSETITGTLLFKVYGPKQIIEVTIPLKNCTLRVEEEGHDFYAIIDTGIDYLNKEFQKQDYLIEKIKQNQILS